MTPVIKINRSYQEKLKKCLVFHIGLLLCMYRPGISAGNKCGSPGRTADSLYEPSGNEFNERETVSYICTKSDHVLLGHSERQCLKNGSWSDEMPVCSKVAILEVVDLKFPDSEDEENSTVDGNISTCPAASKLNRTIWRGYLPTSVNIYAVQVSVLGIREVYIDVIVEEANSSKRCEIKSGNAESSIKPITTVTFYCPAATIGKYVYISCNNQSLSFCEVSVLFPPDPSCFYPDRPLHSTGFKTSLKGKSENYRFTCQTGYKLWGTLAADCQTDGRWLPRSPVCEEIYCNAPDSIENGYVEYNLNKGKIPYNGIARYSCKEGFSLDGISIIRCHRWDEWDSPPPICKPRVTENTASTKDLPVTESWTQTNVTHCGSLPHIANGRVTTNSSNIGSAAWLKCFEGFKPLTDDHIFCLPTGKWSSQSLHCTFIQCEVDPIIPHGKAILLDNSSYYGSHLEIKCNQGYTSHTPITRKCNEFGTWGDLRICVEITCGAFNSNEAGHDQWLYVNGSASLRVLTCPKDFHIEGSPVVIRCLSNGSWSYTSAKCKKPFWGSNWTPSLILTTAVAAGVGAAIVILCLSMAFLVIKKRCQTQTNTTVFHLENTSQKDRMREVNDHRQKHHLAAENYNMVERRSKSACTNPRKPRSALPNLPLDADPVYAQPFETASATKKASITISSKKDDLYNTHIYAEPVDSRRHTPTHILVNINDARMGTDRRSSAVKTNFGNEPPRSIPTDQQNCDKKCAIYDSSRNSTQNGGQLTTDGKFQTYNERTQVNTLTKKLDYLELL